MSDNNLVPPRFFMFCFMIIAMFLLVLYSSFLLHFSSHSFIPRSVLDLVLANNTSLDFKPSFKREHITPPLHSQVSKVQPQRCQLFNSSQKSTSPKQLRKMACDTTLALLRVFMYDLPPEFHFGLLDWKGSANQTWPIVNNPKHVPPYPGGLNLQHSVEYWLTLDLLSSNIANVFRPCSAIRVQNASQADVVFVPFFSSLSYNQHSKIHGKEKVSVNKMLQGRLVQFLMEREEWKRSGGTDHVIVAHHPNSMVHARRKLGSSIFVLADFGRYHSKIANIQKDIIAPYRHLVNTIPRAESASYKERSTLLYFQGAIYRKSGGAVRREIYHLLKDEKDVHFTFGSIRRNGIKQASQGMALSKFCLNIAGDTPSSNRLFDAIVSHCVPVIISDEIELPFEDVLDYSEFSLFVRASDAVRKGYLLNLLRSIKPEKWTKMCERLKDITQHFEYQYPSQPRDAVNMIWEQVAHKISSLQLNLHRKNRYHTRDLSFLL
ncbi:hypothetical protein PHAVU_003G190200 [Phaseolus vulgaris]|uniref:Exostosin GT47 domain-containing protein n=1 Tax=Phaseolus vulgaris TaxID=3885 RepID=V7CDE4_PHAVU|nr:hypothetical protein PHAVU_003G190200g [Phaseolus vulgaris]ESW27305.1 hypothetical protein PHAVU_003G190200g [Phaseolus vulgaris]